MTIHPFTENASAEEREVMLLMLIIEALHTNPLRLDSVDKYNLIFKVLADLREDLDSLDDAVVMEITDDEVEIRLAEEVRPENLNAEKDFSDEPEFQRLKG